jgi:hypothetical protein
METADTTNKTAIAIAIVLIGNQFHVKLFNRIASKEKLSRATTIIEKKSNQRSQTSKSASRCHSLMYTLSVVSMTPLVHLLKSSFDGPTQRIDNEAK